MPGADQQKKAIAAFDAYNERDPNRESYRGEMVSKEWLYSVRMTERLNVDAPEAPEHVQLAVRCQHIGRWEIPRLSFEMNRKGYLQWRNQLKMHHSGIAEEILEECGYTHETIEKVKFLLQKKQLFQNPETQLMEDVICLVFVEFYLKEFAGKHADEKVVDILNKTLRKMSPRAIQEALTLPLPKNLKELLSRTSIE